MIAPNASAAPAHDLKNLSRRQKELLLEMLQEKEKRLAIVDAKNDLIQFAKLVYPGFAVGAHHKIIAKLFKEVAEGTKNRVIINVAPRHGKSLLTSFLFPAWYLGQHPKSQIIMATHTASLSEDFGRQVRNLIMSNEYHNIFPETTIADDSKSAGAWNTSVGGKYLAVGVGGALAGRGADLCIAPETTIITRRGRVKACEVRVGDFVLGDGGWGRVTRLFSSVSTQSVVLNGVTMTPNHPVFVYGKGWVPACQVQIGDTLRSVPWVVEKLRLLARFVVRKLQRSAI